jgi:hypothetical protein
VAHTTASRQESVYRFLLWLYPRELRAAYGAEMVQVFGDLVRERGRSTWGRVALDLAVSVPRTRLESLMHRTAAHTEVTVAVLAIGVLVSVAALLMFGPLGLPVPVVVAAVALSQRSRLARSLGADEQHRRVGTALIGLVTSALTFVGTLTAWIFGISRGYDFDDTVLLVFNLFGFGSLIATISFGVVFLHRRRAQRASATA